jgi:hypothetical protein
MRASIVTLLFGLSSLLLPVPSLAGRINGNVLEVTQQVVNGIPALLVVTSGLEDPLAPCHSSSATRMWIDLRTDHGRLMATLAHIAIATGMSVRVGGTGTCTVQPDIETADFFILNRN